jgi:hypothetical protein
MTLTKEEVQKLAERKDFLPAREEGIFLNWLDLNGANARKYLESKGFVVIRNYDTGKNGLAITECGIKLSTNGFIYK